MKRLQILGRREDAELRVAIHAATIQRDEQPALEPRIRDAVARVHRERDERLLPLEQHVRALRGVKTEEAQATAARAFTRLVEQAPRHIIYQLTPRAIRTAIRAARIARSPMVAASRAPVAIARHLLPPPIRVAVDVVGLLRDAVRGADRDRGMDR